MQEVAWKYMQERMKEKVDELQKKINDTNPETYDANINYKRMVLREVYDEMIHAMEKQIEHMVQLENKTNESSIDNDDDPYPII